jgi:hypothetical protein
VIRALIDTALSLYDENDGLTAERDMAVEFRDQWYASDLPQMQRLAMWLNPDSDLPLPNLVTLVKGAMEREAKALDALRLAEAEATALRTQVATLREALERTFGNLKRLLARTPVRDVAETIAEAEAALASTQEAEEVTQLRELEPLLRTALAYIEIGQQHGQDSIGVRNTIAGIRAALAATPGTEEP